MKRAVEATNRADVPETKGEGSLPKTTSLGSDSDASGSYCCVLVLTTVRIDAVEPLNRPMPLVLAGIRYSFLLRSVKGGRLRLGTIFVKMSTPGRASIARLSLSHVPAPGKRRADWADAAAEVIVRRCPVCSRDAVIGHGRRRKQAHDEHHDWIRIRRGICRACGKTITFLPVFSLPYTHYSLIARRLFRDSRNTIREMEPDGAIGQSLANQKALHCAKVEAALGVEIQICQGFTFFGEKSVDTHAPRACRRRFAACDIPERRAGLRLFRSVESADP